MNKKTLVVDLDGTLCDQRDSETYHLAVPALGVIEKVNRLYSDGWKIIIHTARGMNTCDGDVDEIEFRYGLMTREWLYAWGVQYHELWFGKPPGDLYIDDKGMSIDEFMK